MSPKLVSKEDDKRIELKGLLDQVLDASDRDLMGVNTSGDCEGVRSEDQGLSA